MNENYENMKELQEGDIGNDVIILQNKLKILGLFDTSVTGEFGPETTYAVKKFQQAYNLEPTGIVNNKTWNILFKETPSPFPMNDQTNNINTRASKPVLRLGDKGPYVKELQIQLKQLLYYDNEINSTFDKNTETAVKIFQTTNKLTSDGIVGRDTWSALAFLYSPLAICQNNDGNITYIVRKGDTLYSIAKKYQVSVDEIKKLNNLTSNTLQIGKELLIKQAGNINNDNEVYVVKKGDTLYSISKLLNTTVDALKKANNLSSNILTIGQQLIIPNSLNNYQIYIVQRGDTLYSIARKFNVDVNTIKTANNLNSNIISINQQLLIPNI